jgi:chorismate mutase
LRAAINAASSSADGTKPLEASQQNALSCADYPVDVIAKIVASHPYSLIDAPLVLEPISNGIELVETPPELQALRDSIDNLDAALVHILAERFKCTQRVGELKARLQLPSSDASRERQQVERLRTLARAANLDPDFAEKFLAFIINEVIRHHETARVGIASSN